MVETQASILATLASAEPGVRGALYGLIGLLLLIMACLVACVIILRRRARASAAKLEAERDAAAEVAEQERWPAMAADGSFEQPTDDPMACPSCRRELAAGLAFCPYDATRLVQASQMLDHVLDKRHGSRICPSCRRAFESSVRYCPHDGSDLVPMALHQPACDHDHADASVAKICPRCRGRYEYAALFCGKDGVELVVLN